jgi:hypothetical protein
VDGNASGSCPMADLAISGVKISVPDFTLIICILFHLSVKESLRVIGLHIMTTDLYSCHK